MKKKRTPAGRPESQRAVRTESDELVRLNRYLALNGIASRRRADELIAAGEVMVDGEIVTELGHKVDPARQRVEVDGVVLRAEGERRRYYLVSKPSGVVCTSDPRESRTRAIDLVTDRRKGRIYTVGRLDEDTTGLVILTNDGDFANRISHPRYGISKTYRVMVRGKIDHDELRKLRQGVQLSDFRSSFTRVKIMKRTELRSVLLVTLKGGRNREVRRVFARLGYAVKELRRVQIGSLTERGLKIGHWRPLTRAEVGALLELAQERPPASGIKPRRRRSARQPRSAPNRKRAVRTEARGQRRQAGRRP